MISFVITHKDYSFFTFLPAHLLHTQEQSLTVQYMHNTAVHTVGHTHPHCSTL